MLTLERHTPGRVSLGIKLKRVVWNVTRRWPWGGMGVEIGENAVYKNVESWIVVNENPYKIIKGASDKPCGGSADANPKTCCQTISDCQKVVPLHYESEWQYKHV